MFDKIAVIGVGLLGGSLCRCLKTRAAGVRITGVSSDPRELELALSDGSIDACSTLDDLPLSDIDLVVIATPVVASLSILDYLLERGDLRNDALVIDVGSVKSSLVETAKKHRRSDRFIGCHPMAGSEKYGYVNSSADLYDGASVIITPADANTQSDIARIIELWNLAGAKTVIADSDTHDRIVAYTSHLPHMVACGVMNSLVDFMQVRRDVDVSAFTGRGFRDVTRISSGSPDMWADIVKLNRDNIALALRCMIDNLSTVLEAVEAGSYRDVMSYLLKAKGKKDNLK